MASTDTTVATAASTHSGHGKCAFVALVLLLLAVPLTGQAQSAYVEGDRVYLPVVEAYPANKSLELRILRGGFPIVFALEATGPAQGPVRLSSAWYSGGLLIVPEVWIDGQSYWADLRVLSNTRFRLEAFGPNPVSPGSGNYQHTDWQYMLDDVEDVGVGANGHVWAVSNSWYGDGYGLYEWDGKTWWESRGSAVRVDVDPHGNPWVVNEYNEIWRLLRGHWELLSGAATDIGIGADGSVWVIGTNSRRGGYAIYRLDHFGWMRVEGAGVRIDVDAYGTPWVINDADEIFRLENGLWRRLPGRARDIGIGADGSVWAIGMDDRAGGHGIYRFNGSDWDKVPGSGSHISVGPDGEPWVVNRSGDLYRSFGNYY